MHIIPPSSPPPPMSLEEEKLVAEAEAFFESIKNLPPVSRSLQEKASEDPSETDVDSENSPLI
jgi:hypothetical protein